MAEKACHGFGSTTQVGLTQALGRKGELGPVDEIYRDLIEATRRNGRTTDYRAGQLKAEYILKRRLFGSGAIVIFVAGLVLSGNTGSWLVGILSFLSFCAASMYCMGRTVRLEHSIRDVSERVPDHYYVFLHEFLSPHAELYRIFLTWQDDGPLWWHDEGRLVLIAQYANAIEKHGDDAAA